MPAIGTAPLMKPRLATTVQAAIALPAITMRANKERFPTFTAQTNPQPQNNFAMLRHPPSQAGLDNGYGFVAPWNSFMWVPIEGCHTGNPVAYDGGVPSPIPASDATIHNFPPGRMTTGQMTCASGADDVFPPPEQKATLSDDR